MKQNERVQTMLNSVHKTLTFTSDGKRLLSMGFGPNMLVDRGRGDVGPTVNQWDVQTGKRLSLRVEQRVNATSGAYSPDERYLGLVFGNEAKVFDLVANAPPMVVKSRYMSISQIAFAPRSGRVAVADHRAVRIWSSPKDIGMQDGYPLLSTPLMDQNTSCIRFSADGRHLVAGMNDGTLLVFTLLQNQL
jgi:WD40 repeat protein